MDDVEITDVNEGGIQVEKHPPKNRDLTSLSILAGELLSQYGWYLLAVTVLVYLLIQHLKKRRSSQSCQSSAPQTPQDAALVAKRQEAMEAARRKMQEQLDASAAIYKEKQKQKQQQKQMNQEASSSTTMLKPKTDKKPLRSTDYSPLSGQGGGTCSWRPGRRGPSSGG
ncbi:selenoprotein S [Lates calcarifer]|uniref:Selenoprotein S n=1 Tax=Lates calcarifer TaxID=8187 RepID=A0AAJ7Q6N6_LATCA|nr:selenoprotein S [Lates calcarifer]